ncbi:MAG: OmpA family protein [Bacteroidales bacterium]|nr:OmpA family protein [Bacteroidales bacterium]
MKKIVTLISILFIITSTNLFAQKNVEFDKDNFRSNKEGFKRAYSNFKEGNKFFEDGKYLLALDVYIKANHFNSNNATLNYRIGVSYLQSVQKTKSLEFLKKSYALNRNVDPELDLMLGQSYHLNSQFDKAIEEYKTYRNSLSFNELQKKGVVIDKYIDECNNGKNLIKTPVRAFIDNLGKIVNSSYSDHSPVISADEETMYFTSTRENSVGGKKDVYDQEYDEDIYVTRNRNGKWSNPHNMRDPLNTSKDDATVGLSSDGQQLLTFNGRKNGGDIQIAYLSGVTWSSPKSFSKSINTPYHESSACFSSDASIVYFVCDKPNDNYGGSDIFYSKKSRNDKWGDAINIGPVINTKYDEEGVYMHPDGRTMYFSSKGHNSMGGYDIFKTTMDERGKWSEPVNLGYPINTPDNDLSFVLTGSGKHGYYSSEREGGFGRSDIYMVTFLGPEKPLVQSNEDNLIASIANPITETVVEATVEIKKIRLTIVKGAVKDAITLKPISAQIEIVDNDKNEVVLNYTTNSESGKFLVSLPSGKNYGMTVKATDYLFHSENFNIPKATAYQEFDKDIMLNNIKKDAKIILKNVFFDAGKATLRPTSYAELGRLTKLLNDIPTLRIEISGHTDNTGSLQTNKKLSESRAKSVVDFIIAEGIDKSRLEYKGYAYFQPIATNDTEDGRQKNRRVEFKILSK